MRDLAQALVADSIRSYNTRSSMQPTDKTRLTAGFGYGWRTRIIRAARSPCGPPP